MLGQNSRNHLDELNKRDDANVDNSIFDILLDKSLEGDEVQVTPQYRDNCNPGTGDSNFHRFVSINRGSNISLSLTMVNFGKQGERSESIPRGADLGMILTISISVVGRAVK